MIQVYQKIKFFVKIVIFVLLNHNGFSQNENILYKANDINILNNTLICKKYFDQDSFSMSVDTFFIKLGKQVYIDNTKYYKLNWGDKDVTNGNIRIKNGVFWYRPICKNYSQKEYKLFDFNSTNPTTIFCLGGFFTKYKITKTNEKYYKKSDDLIFTFKVEDFTQLPYYYLDEITYSSKRGIIEVVMHYLHSDFKEIRCSLCEGVNK